ncbi:hypothetical protein N3K66_005021 [Trichothecium roseum]|uniref:Uncharacterized protein n=1 Tax=Trichothecium roseum TaxID=47278 RepID=A0ACC0V2T3_9HYPO|nr:hypothetical protein N3K66_005021 [Trichothecium roseum]
MASSASSQSLLAAFSSGLVFIAASVAIILSFKNHGAALFRHALRLVLIIFFFSSGLWALTIFVATLINTVGNGGLSNCHIAISFASSFDQLARVAFLQFLLWAICPAAKSLIFTLGLQGAISLRFVLGGIFVGVQRPQFDPSCVARSIVVPLGVVALVCDCIFPTVFLIHAITRQPAQDARGRIADGSSRTGPGTKKSHVLNIAAFAIWTAMSSPLMLALDTLNLVLRTVVPALGLLVILVVVMFSSRNTSSQAAAVDEMTKDVVDAYIGTGHSRKASKPEIPSRKSSASYSQWRPSTETDRSVSMAQSQARHSDLNKALPSISQPRPGQQGDEDRNPLHRVPTIDLRTAAENDKEKRRQQKEAIEMRALSSTRVSKPASTPPDQILQRSKSTGSATKQVAYAVTSPTQRRSLETIRESGATALTSSIQPSPGIEDVRRRSPQPSAGFDVHFASAPIPPLKTPGTLNNSFAFPNPPSAETAHIAGLLAIPANLGAPLEPPARSPLRVQKNAEETRAPPSEISRPSRSRSASSNRSRSRSRSRSQSPGHHRRSSSVSSNRSKTGGVFFTDSGVPPAIPKDCADESFSGSIASTSHGASVVRSQSSSASSAPGQGKNTSPGQGTKFHPRMSTFPKVPTRSQSTRLPPQLWVEQVSNIEIRPHKQAAPSQDSTSTLGRPSIQVHNVQVNDALAAHAALAARCNNTYRKTDSIVHRPRPIPRKPEDIISHYGMRRLNRRSLSCSSARSSKGKQCLLRSECSCSPQHLPPLPPLPPLPISAVAPIRPKPNDTNSMTFDEKVAMLFALSPSATTSSSIAKKRRSSLPTIHSFVEAEDAADSFGGSRDNRLTQSTIRTVSLFGEEEQDRHPSRSSAVLTRRQTHNTRSRSERYSTPSSNSLKRQSSPVLPPTYLSPASTHNSWDEDDGASTIVPPIPGQLTIPYQTLNVSHFSATTMADTAFGVGEDDDDISIVREDEDDEISLEFDSRSPIEAEPESESEPSVSPQNAINIGPWHRRVGEPCPTFTSREGRCKPRKAPPPPPLRLWKPGQAPVFIEAEPSPLESPEDALKAIEEQLDNFNDSPQDEDATMQQRMTLLQDLEQEMGQQENEWQRMRHTMIRDSLSTIGGSPRRGASRPPSIPAIDRSSIGAMLASRFRNSNYRPMSEDKAGGSTLAQAQALVLQQSLSSQAEHRISRLSVVGDKVNFLAISNPATSQLGSPTPPDTDESDVESEVEVPLVIQGAVLEDKLPAPRLWSPAADARPIAVNAMLWAPESRPRSPLFTQSSIPRAPRREHAKASSSMLPLLMSKHMWIAPKPKTYVPRHTGLWKPCPLPPIPVSTTKSEPSPTSERPKLARKPLRKSKRLTQLPDIIESPQPLPRSETLGIFQYPWGAPFNSTRSPAANASSSPRRPVTAMPGTMSSGSGIGSGNGSGAFGAYVADFGLGVMARGQFSFFEEEDEEDVGDNFSDSEDDFDEGVLWEIASLLQTQRVISPGDLAAAEEAGWPGAVSPIQESIPMVLDVKPLRSTTPPKAPVPALWEDEKKFYKMKNSHGLSQPSKATWSNYLSEAHPTEKRAARRQRDNQPLKLGSQHLWEKASAPELSSSLLWAITEPLEPTVVAPPAREATVTETTLWTSPKASKQPHPHAMWTAITEPSSAAQSSWINYLSEALHADRRTPRRQRDNEALQLGSQHLWAKISPREPSSSPLWTTTKPPKPTTAIAPIRETMLWSPPKASESQSEHGMWAASLKTAPAAQSPLIGYLSEALPMSKRTFRRQQDSRPLRLSSQRLWEKMSVSEPSSSLLWAMANPLKPVPATSLKSAVMESFLWSAPKNSNSQSQDGMWAASLVVSPTVQSRWEPSAPIIRRKTAAVSPSAVSSTALWSTPAPEPRHNWLLASSCRPVHPATVAAAATTSKAELWASPSPILDSGSLEQRRSLWTLPPARRTRVPLSVCDSSPATARRAGSNTARHAASVGGIRSVTLWTKPTAQERAAKNWIMSSPTADRQRKATTENHLWSKPSSSAPPCPPREERATLWQQPESQPRHFAHLMTAPPRRANAKRTVDTTPLKDFGGQPMWAAAAADVIGSPFVVVKVEDRMQDASALDGEEEEDVGDVDAYSEEWVGLS